MHLCVLIFKCSIRVSFPARHTPIPFFDSAYSAATPFAFRFFTCESSFKLGGKVLFPRKKIAVSSLRGGSALSKHQTPFWLLKANTAFAFCMFFHCQAQAFICFSGRFTGNSSP
jgi:hypothetical protein